MKKILFTIWTASLGGGAEKILFNLVEELDKEYEIDILEICKFKEINVKLGKNTKLLRPMLDKVSDNIYIYILKRIVFEYFPNLYKRFICRKEYDYEIAFNYLYPAYLINKTSKSIAWNHGSIENLLDNLEYKNRKKYGRALKNFNRIVAISNKTEKSIINVYPEHKEKIVKIYNGYNFFDIINKSKEYVDFEYDSLIFLGRLEEAKGIKTLLDIYLELVKKGINKKLYILGEGELKKYIEDFVIENDLANKVILLGYINNPYPYIKNSSYVIMPSIAEGFPTVFVEGLALGVGFISTDVGGVEELSNNGLCGFVGYSNKNFVDYLYIELKKDKNDRIIKSENCLHHVKNYTLDKQIKSLKNLFEEIDNE